MTETVLQSTLFCTPFGSMRPKFVGAGPVYGDVPVESLTLDQLNQIFHHFFATRTAQGRNGL